LVALVVIVHLVQLLLLEAETEVVLSAMEVVAALVAETEVTATRSTVEVLELLDKVMAVEALEMTVERVVAEEPLAVVVVGQHILQAAAVVAEHLR